MNGEGFKKYTNRAAHHEQILSHLKAVGTPHSPAESVPVKNDSSCRADETEVLGKSLS